jgi:hypothetical protein
MWIVISHISMLVHTESHHVNLDAYAVIAT